MFAFGALLFVAGCLTLEHMRGGVVSHHLLADPNLPAISNWFGALTLPALGALFGYRLALTKRSRAMFTIFAIALLYGAVLAGTFAYDAPHLTNTMFMALAPLAVLLPIYRIEYVFGFVVGTTYTFGGVLPLLIWVVFGTMSYVLRWVIKTLWRKIKHR